MNTLKDMSDQSFNIDRNSLGQDIGMPSDNSDDIIYLSVIREREGGEGVIIYKDCTK